MSTVMTGASVSLDGYISGPDESGFEHLFDWYNNGEVPLETVNPDVSMRMTEGNVAYVNALKEATGALVVGRKLFDFTNGWGGRHPLDCPVVVLTHRPPADWPHPDAPFTFVTDGIEAAVATAKELAGGKVVAANGGRIASQCLDAGLLDEVWVDLVPVILGAGTRYFDQLGRVPVVLDGPLSVGDERRVTHLRYRVRR